MSCYLKYDTKIPTQSGFKRMLDLEIGDKLFDEMGNICNIVSKSNIFCSSACEVSFIQGGTVVVGENHHWWVQSANSRKRKNNAYLTLKTKDMLKDVIIRKDKRKNYSVDVCKPINLPTIKLPIDPYLLGLWLGDGNTYKAAIYTADSEMIDSFRKFGYDISKLYGKYSYGIRGGFFSLLKENNLLGNKHIPNLYFHSSFNQRLSLIQGLMDSDGHIRKYGVCEICLKDINLINGIKDLLCSFGIKTKIKQVYKRATNTNQKPSLYYLLTFTTNIPIFRLKRKLLNIPSSLRSTQYRRYICSIIKVKNIDTVEIIVDSPNNIFLCTEDYIPTCDGLYSLKN